MSMEKAKEKIQKFRQREQQILDTALELLLAHGEDKVTVEQIADKVDIGKGTIYKHFTSKVEIYMQLLLDYERSLTERLQEAMVKAAQGDIAAVPRAYFTARMSDPTRDRLFRRLEERIIAQEQAPELMEELKKLRDANIEMVNAYVQGRIDDGALEDVPPHYHYFAYWALTQGAVDLYHTSYAEQLGDMDELMRFIMNIGVNMGAKRKPKE